MKVDVMSYGTHKPIDESHWVSRLRENFTSGSNGEGLETGRLVPRQSFTRQLFFKWIKQNLRIKTFYGTSENAVKAQIWIAVSVYLLVAIMKKRLKIEASLYTILQVMSVTIFERMLLLQVLTKEQCITKTNGNSKQLLLFD